VSSPFLAPWGRILKTIHSPLCAGGVVVFFREKGFAPARRDPFFYLPVPMLAKSACIRGDRGNSLIKTYRFGVNFQVQTIPPSGGGVVVFFRGKKGLFCAPFPRHFPKCMALFQAHGGVVVFDPQFKERGVVVFRRSNRSLVKGSRTGTGVV
jgi:hypothetical protein